MVISKKNVAASFMGIAGSQIILFLCFGLIGRAWGAEVLGEFNLSLTLAASLSVVAALRYELACISNSEREAYRAFIHTIVVASVVLLAICGSIFLLGYDSFSIVFLSAALALQQAAAFYFNTLRRYIVIALAKISLAAVFFLILCASSIANEKNDPFSIYIFSGILVSAVLVYAILDRKKSNKITMDFFKENKSFPKFSLLAAILNSALTNALPIAIPFMFGSLSAGFFAAAQRFGFAPVSLITQSINGVFRRELLSAINSTPEDALNCYMVHAKLVTMISLGYLLVGNLLFGLVIRLILGDGWEVAVDYFHILSPLYALSILYGSLSPVFIVVGAFRKDLLMQILIFLSATIPLAYSYFASTGIISTLALFSTTTSSVLVYGVWMTYKVLKRKVIC